MVLGIWVAAAQSASAQRTEAESRGGLRLPDFTCFIEAHHVQWHRFGGGFGGLEPYVTWEALQNGQTFLSYGERTHYTSGGKQPNFRFTFRVRNVGPLAANLSEWSYTVTQNGWSAANVLNSGQTTIRLEDTSPVQAAYFDFYTEELPPLKPGLNTMSGNFTARSPLQELSKSNNACTFRFIIDYHPA
jgi:hypothetical protein